MLRVVKETRIYLDRRRTAQMSRPKISKAKRSWLEHVLWLALEELRAILRERAAAHFKAHPTAPRPCDTCAFKRSQDGTRGMDTTAWNIVQAIRDERPFYCHKPYVKGRDYEPTSDRRLCGSYLAIAADERIADALSRALVKAPPCPERDSSGAALYSLA